MQAIGGYGRTALGAGALHGWQVRHLNPVERVLRTARVPYLAKHVTHMLYPNYPGRSPYNRHYCYKRGAGWVSDIVTLSRPSTKYDVINGSLVTIPAGEFGANGRVEPATVTRITNSNDKANWVARGTCAVTDHATGGPANAPYIEVTGLDAQGVNDLYISSMGYAANASLRDSFYIRLVSGSDTLYFTSTIDFAIGNRNISTSALPVGQWVRVDESHASTVVDATKKADATGASGLNFFAGSTLAFDFCFVNETESQTYTTTPILAAGVVTTRAADAWSVVDDFSAVKSMGVAGKLASFTDSARILSLKVAATHSRQFDMRPISTSRIDCYNEGGSDGSVTGLTLTGEYAAAVTQDGASLKMSINGSAINTQAGAANQNPDALLINDWLNKPGGHECHAVLLFDRALTDAEMQALTGTAFRNAIAAGL